MMITPPCVLSVMSCTRSPLSSAVHSVGALAALQGVSQGDLLSTWRTLVSLTWNAPPLQHIAHKMTPGGDQRLLDEALAIVRQAGEDGAFAMHRGPRGETKDLYHWARMYSCERSPDRLWFLWCASQWWCAHRLRVAAGAVRPSRLVDAHR